MYNYVVTMCHDMYLTTDMPSMLIYIEYLYNIFLISVDIAFIGYNPSDVLSTVEGRI